jgi:predicted RNA-binding Zn ribbon-like protein
MPFSHDMVYSLATVVDLVNTSPSAGGREGLLSLADLEEFVQRRRVSGVRAVAEDDLTQVRALREAFHGVFLAEGRAAAASRLNALLGRTRMTPSLIEHDGFPLHMHYFAPGASLAAHVLVEGEFERLRTCAAPDCANVFVDESRNRSRVYCDSRTCGNRMHVAAYRARRRA